jgi:hypothetical protein
MVMARFSVWRRRFPDRVVQAEDVARPKRGRPSKSENISEFLGGAPQAMGFAAETAAEVGLTDRTIRAALSTVNGLPADLRQQLRGTWIGKTEGVLRQLANIADKAEQRRVAELMIEGGARSVSDAIALAAGNLPVKAAQTPVDETLKAFRKLWGSASPGARAAILHDLAGRPLPKGWIVRGTADG